MLILVDFSGARMSLESINVSSITEEILIFQRD